MAKTKKPTGKTVSGAKAAAKPKRKKPPAKNPTPTKKTAASAAGKTAVKVADPAQPSVGLRLSGLFAGLHGWLVAGAAMVGAVVLGGAVMFAGIMLWQSAEPSSGDPVVVAVDQVLMSRLEALEVLINDNAEKLAGDVLAVPDSASDLGVVQVDVEAVAVMIAGLRDDLTGLAAQVDEFGAVQNTQDLLLGARDQKIVTVQLSVVDLRALLGQTQERLAALQGFVEQSLEAPGVSRRAALALVLSSLVRAIEVGHGFGHELKAAGLLALDHELLAALAPYSAEGLPVAAQLTIAFETLIPVLLAADRGAGQAGFFMTLLNNALSIVSVRKTGNVAGDDVQAVLARVEYFLDQGDLTQAVQEAGGLSGDTGKAVAGWLAAARGRLQLDELARALNSEALALFSDFTPVSAGSAPVE